VTQLCYVGNAHMHIIAIADWYWYRLAGGYNGYGSIFFFFIFFTYRSYDTRSYRIRQWVATAMRARQSCKPIVEGVVLTGEM